MVNQSSEPYYICFLQNPSQGSTDQNRSWIPDPSFTDKARKFNFPKHKKIYKDHNIENVS